jgi:hypothetical protein
LGGVGGGGGAAPPVRSVQTQQLARVRVSVRVLVFRVQQLTRVWVVDNLLPPARLCLQVMHSLLEQGLDVLASDAVESGRRWVRACFWAIAGSQQSTAELKQSITPYVH